MRAIVPERNRAERSPGGDEFSGESGDEYAQQKRAKPKKARRTKDGDAEGRPVPRKRKRRSVPREEVDASQLDVEPGTSWQERFCGICVLIRHVGVVGKHKLDMQIEAILKPKKASRRKKGKNDEDVLDRAADEEVSRLRESMLLAAQEDEQANREKMPATSKLRLLPTVVETLRKYVSRELTPTG